VDQPFCGAPARCRGQAGMLEGHRLTQASDVLHGTEALPARACMDVLALQGCCLGLGAGCHPAARHQGTGAVGGAAV